MCGVSSEGYERLWGNQTSASWLEGVEGADQKIARPRRISVGAPERELLSARDRVAVPVAAL